MEGGSDEIMKAFEESLSNFKKYYFNITDKSSNQDLKIIADIESRFRDLYRVIASILEKRGDITKIPKEDMETYTVYTMLERNGNVCTRLSKSEDTQLPERMRNTAQVHLLEYTCTPGPNHVHILKSEHVPSSKTFVENK
jgi:flavorubredoxin